MRLPKRQSEFAKHLEFRTMKRVQIGIIGSAGPEEYQQRKPNTGIYTVAYEVGRLITQKGAILICGGKGGVMEASCKVAKECGGITVGVISGNKRGQSNEYIDVEIVSGIVNCGEEALIVSMSDGIIAVGGGAGTLQELALAYRNKKPVVAFRTFPGWSKSVANTFLDNRKLIKISVADTPKEAVTKLFSRIRCGG